MVIFFIGTIPAARMSGIKLFTLLDTSQTHVYFNNEIVDKKDHSILLYANYYGGAGVGIGDINNDGLQDIYFAGNLVGDRLYLNKGNMQFEDITEKAGIKDNGGWSSGVLFGDVNGDGYQDIYVTRELYDDHPELRVNAFYINNKDNTFTECAEKYGIADSSRTRHATFLDYDKDGDLDLFLLNQPPNPGVYSQYYNTELLTDQYSPRLLENQGDKFVDVTKKAGLFRPCFPNSVTASDLNGDGWTDLWVSNDFWAGDFLYINNGDGTFTDMINENVRHITFSSMGIDAGDINNDGRLDVMVLDMVPEKHIRLQSNMGGMSPKAFQDVVNEGGHYQYFTNTLFLNVGNGRFSEFVHLAGMPSTDWSWTTFFADLDNDGWKDVFIANGLRRDIRDYDAAVDFPAFIESAIHKFLQENPNPENISIWDVVDMQKALDISPSVKLENYAFKNNRDLTFSKMTEEWGFDQKTFSNGAAYADLDNDGDLDLVINNVNDIASVYRNNEEGVGSNHFLRIVPVADGDHVTSLGTKIWIETDDGLQFYEMTSVRGIYSTSEHIAHFGLGGQKKVNLVTVRWPDGRENILKNVKADQILEVKYSKSRMEQPDPVWTDPPIFTDYGNESGIIYKHQENVFDDYSRQLLLPYKMSQLGPCIASGDYNGDGLEDFFVGGAAGFTGQLFRQITPGVFMPDSSAFLEDDKIFEDMGSAFFDADRDGDLDLYIVTGGNEFRPRSSFYQDRLYLNDGTGKFNKTENWLPKMYESGSKVYPFDFDGDGDMDLFIAGRHIPWSYPDPESSNILQNQGGKFENVTREIAPGLQGIGMVNDASWVDFNNDGLVDLVLAGEWMPVTLFQNTGGKFQNVTRDYGLDQTVGWWFSIASADMDHDGDMDMIAGNFGLNSQIKGTKDSPFEVYYYDFDNNGRKDLVFAYTEDHKKYPYTRKKYAAQLLPYIDDKFQTFSSYAKADIFEIYGKENLDRALHYSADSFASVYLENSGNGHFTVHQLPNLAQFSSINDILIDDFNEDKNPDILIAGNLYNMEVQTPRNDAGFGLLLEGDGKGQFKPVSNLKSGFYVPYDVKSLATVHGDGTELILVGCNNDSLRVFRVTRLNNF